MAEAEGSVSFVISAPGKLILTGEHAVVYGKLALAASVDLLTRIRLTTFPSSSSSLTISFDNLKLDWSINLDDLMAVILAGNPSSVPDLDVELLDRLKTLLSLNEMDQAARNSLLALLYLYCSVVGRPIGANIRVTSEIPIGAGLGSSAAFSVVVSAVCHLLNHLAEGRGENSFTPDLELINSWAFQCERLFHATPSGIDNAVSSYGGVVKFEEKKVSGNLEVPEARILLVNTHVSRQTKLLVEAVRKKRDRFPSVVNPILDSIHQISLAMVDVIVQQDHNYTAIQELLSMNHWLLASLGVSHGTLDEIYGLARAHNQAAKLTGAGGGGLAFIWLNPSCTDEQLDALRYELLNRGNYTLQTARLGVKGLQIQPL